MGNQNKFPAPFDGKPMIARMTATALEMDNFKMTSVEQGEALAFT